MRCKATVSAERIHHFRIRPLCQRMLPNFLKVMRRLLEKFALRILGFAICALPSFHVPQCRSHTTSSYLHYLHAISIERVSMQEGTERHRLRPVSIVHLQIAMHRRRRMIRGPSSCDVCKNVRLALPGMQFHTASL